MALYMTWVDMLIARSPFHFQPEPNLQKFLATMPVKCFWTTGLMQDNFLSHFGVCQKGVEVEEDLEEKAIMLAENDLWVNKHRRDDKGHEEEKGRAQGTFRAGPSRVPDKLLQRPKKKTVTSTFPTQQNSSGIRGSSVNEEFDDSSKSTRAK